jgi:ATP-dependent RNA helicase SUPV3L1/SUV3
VLTADEHLSPPDRERIVRRVQAWLNAHIETRLKPLIELARAQDLAGLARGIAYRIVENLGILPRESVANELRALDQQARAELRKFGVRFGAYNIYIPLLLKPAAADLLLLLWGLKHGASAGLNLADLPEPPRQGLTSVPVDRAYPASFYRAAGFQICGPRAVRIDMLERLADLIRPLSSWKPTEANPEPPAGAVGRGGFKVQPEMMSIMGCSADELGNVLFSLGFRKERRPIVVKPAAQPEAAVTSESFVESGSVLEVQADEPSSTQDAASDQEADLPLAAAPEPAGAVAAMTTADPAEATEPAAQFLGDAAAGDTAEPEAAAPTQAAPEIDGMAALTASSEAAETEAAEQSAAGAPGAAVAATEEQQFEEIWRPRRRGQGDERRPQQQRRNENRPDRQRNAPHRDRGPRPGQGDGTPAAAVPVSAEQSSAPQQPQQHPRRDHRQGDHRQGGDRRRDEQRRDDRPREARPHEGRGREDRRRDDRNKGSGRPQSAGPRVQTASPRPSKGQAANADSPFAALMQLKEQLERGTQDQA